MSIELPSYLGTGLLFGIICALVASGRGRNGLGWFAFGFFANCIALVVLLVLPDLRVEDERQRHLEAQNRRLREQLKKDRNVADRRHVATQERLDVHDRNLNVDTSPLLAHEDVGVMPPPNDVRAGFERALWFYLVGQDQVGPVAFAELKRVWDEGQVASATYVWRDGMAEWEHVRDHPNLENALRA